MCPYACVHAHSSVRACLCVCACRRHHGKQCGQADKGDDGALIKGGARSSMQTMTEAGSDGRWSGGGGGNAAFERSMRAERKEGERGRILTL